MRKNTRKFITAFALLALPGCGFQLAGTTPENNGFDRLFVENKVGIQQLIDQPVAEQLRDDLGGLNTEVSNKARNGIPGLIIVNEGTIERGLSLTNGLFERQIELEKRVQYQIQDAAGNILVADAIGASRELIEDQNTPSAKQTERESLINALNRDISRQLIRRFNSALSR